MTGSISEPAAPTLVPTTPASMPLVAPGIYFGMSEEVYHADPALGSTALKEIVLDPVEYQYSRLHEEEPKETMALKWGHAIHTRALEGQEQFARKFFVAPDKADFEGVLDTYDELKKYCAQHDVKPGRSKTDAIAAVRSFDKQVIIWDEFMANVARANEGKTALPRKAFAEIERAVDWMQRDAKLSPVMENGTFTAGASEVSIFYVDNGVRLKARIDHLLAHAVVDLKSFRPVFSERVHAAARKAVSRMRYDLQAAAYLRALKHALKLFKAGKIFNNPYGEDFLNEVFKSVDSNAMQWVWVLIKASGAPQPIVAEIEQRSMIMKHAMIDIDDAVKTYRTMVDTYGVDSDWRPRHAAEVWSDEDFSPFAFQ